MAEFSEKMRQARLVFYEQDIEEINKILADFLDRSQAKCALLIDKEGHLVTRRGEPLGSSVESISALIAGSFAATKEMARQLGEEEFSILFHQGARDSIQLQLVGERTLLAVLFDQRTNLGLVRFYAQETGRQLAAIFEDMAARPATEETGLSKDFTQDANDALDKLF